MTATHSIAPTLLVAIDISKHRHEVLIDIPGEKRRRRLTITNTLEDFQRRSIRSVSSRATRRPEIEVSGIAARHSRVTSPTTLSTRKRWPLTN